MEIGMAVDQRNTATETSTMRSRIPTVRLDTWVATVVLLAVAAFLILNIPLLNMHPDEELSYRATEGSLLDTVRYQIDLQDNQAPLWFILLRVWRTFVGDSEYTSRMMGVLLVLPALALVYRMARTAFGRQAAAFAPLVLIGNGLFYQYALDIRMYPMVMLVSTISTFLLWRWMQRRTTRTAIFYGISVALMLYTHYLLVFLVVVHALYVLNVLALRSVTKQRTALIGQGIVAGIVAVLLFLPWLPTAVTQVNHLRNVEAVTGTARGGIGIGVSTLPTTPENVSALADFATSNLTQVYGVILVGGVFLIAASRQHLKIRLSRQGLKTSYEPFRNPLKRVRGGAQTRAIDAKTQRRKGNSGSSSVYLLAMLWAVVVPAVYLIVNTRAGVYAPRYVSYLTLGLALAVGGVFGMLPIWRWLQWIPLAALVALNLNNFPATLPLRVPYRDLLTQVSDAAQPGDTVLLVSGGEADGFVQAQLRWYLNPDLNITLDPAVASAQRRVWLLTGDWFNDDVRGVFTSLEQTHPLQQVIGQCDNDWCYLAQLMEAPPLTEPIRFGDALDFRGADVSREGGEFNVDTRLWWTTDGAIPLDYSFSLQLLNQNGNLLANTDGAINHYGAEVVQTSALEPGRIYIDYRQVNFPEQTLQGMYELRLVVYDATTGERLTLADGSDSLLLSVLGLD